MIKIVFTGPESSGKTTMTELLAERLRLPFVPEIAREYLYNLHSRYTYEDVLNIALLQMAEEEKIRSHAPAILICDTDILTSKIWCEDKFNKCEKWVTDAFIHRPADMYFLCNPDFPWQLDPQREDAGRGELLLEMHRAHLKNNKKNCTELSGSIDNRMQKVLQYLSV